MFDLGWTEMMVIGIVALIVVGPKDLPGLFRSVGQFVGKAKGMAREFSSAMNAAADEAGVNEINKTIKAAANPQKFGADKIREATKMDSGADKPETETDKLRAKMTDERKANAKKINDAMAKAAEDRQAAEASEDVGGDKQAAADKSTSATKSPAKKPTAKKTAPKKTAAAKAPPKKDAPKKAAPKAASTRAKSASKPEAAKTAAPKKAAASKDAT